MDNGETGNKQDKNPALLLIVLLWLGILLEWSGKAVLDRLNVDLGTAIAVAVVSSILFFLYYKRRR